MYEFVRPWVYSEKIIFKEPTNISTQYFSNLDHIGSRCYLVYYIQFWCFPWYQFHQKYWIIMYRVPLGQHEWFSMTILQVHGSEYLNMPSWLFYHKNEFRACIDPSFHIFFNSLKHQILANFWVHNICYWVLGYNMIPIQGPFTVTYRNENSALDVSTNMLPVITIIPNAYIYDGLSLEFFCLWWDYTKNSLLIVLWINI